MARAEPTRAAPDERRSGRSAPSSGLRGAVVALRSRDFRLFWSGALVSSVGTWMQNVTVPYVLYQLTHRGLWVGLAIVAQILPSVVLSPVAGSLADRFSRRRILLISQCVQAGCAFALWGAWTGHLRSPVLMLVLVGVAGLASMGTQPAWQAFVSELVPKEDLLNAITLNSAQANGARVVGPAVAGLVLASFGPGWAFLLNALSFLAVIAALLLMRPAERRTARAQGSILAQFGEAVAYSRRHTGILTAFGLTAAVCGLGYPAFQLAPVFAQRVYHIGPGQYGALTGAYGFGAIVGAVVLGVLGAHRLRSDLVRVASAAYGLTLVGFGLTRSFPQGVVLLGLVGMASLPVIAALNTAIQTQVPQHLRGRVLALWVLSYTSSYPVGAVLQGWLADRIGPGPTVVAAGLVMCLVAGSLFARPAVARSLDAYLEPAPEIVVPAEPVTSPQ